VQKTLPNLLRLV